MPDRSEKVLRLQENAGDYELPYISKSRLMQWLNNPEHFRFKYLEGIREPETQAMRRGTDIHETFEHLYERSIEAGGYLTAPQHELPDDRSQWADYITPYISNFLKWENERWLEADQEPDDYLPLGIEEEFWCEDILGIENEPPWMGIADVVLPAASVPWVPENNGAVIVDFKTGSVPDPKYRSPGIYTELEYYSLLGSQKYDVVAAGAYYPRSDFFLGQSAPQQTHRDDVLDGVREMVEASVDYMGDTKFETKEGPLCKWGTGADEESAYYGMCSQCTWGVPANNQEAFLQMLDEGYSYDEIAEDLGTTTDAVSYWEYKLTE